jgi:hypothetical protein
MNNLFKSIVICLVSSYAISSSYAECKITVSSTPVLPLKSLIKNSQLASGIKNWIVGKKSSADTGLYTEDGINCLRLVGGKGTQIRQRIYFKPALAAGDDLFVSFKLKTVDIKNSQGRPGLSINVNYADGTSSYLSVPEAPRFSHDWLTLSKNIVLKKTVKSMTVYCTHYQPTGTSYWRDFVLKSGKVKLNCEITGTELKQVKIYAENIGNIFSSPILSAETTSFKQSLSGKPNAVYYVEVTDYTGKTYTQRYPKLDVPVVAKPNVIPVRKRFNSLICDAKKYEKIAFELPEIKSGKVYLTFSVRGKSKYMHLSGYDNGLILFLNKKMLKAARLFDRKPTFTRPNGHKYATMNNKGFVVYFSPWIVALPESHPYCPVDLKGHNPFNFKFDITDLVKTGNNTLIFKNNLKNKIEITDCQIILP